MAAAASFDKKARKRATNLSVNADLLRQAKELGVNLSQALEERLEQIVRAERRRRWLEGNREAFAAYNDYVEEHGSFADEYNGRFRPDGAP